jgi:outer membrane protein assembly factor BamA
MHAKWEYPYVIWDSVNYTDSVVTYFDTGDRFKIGKIIFVDSTYGQQVVANSHKYKLIRFYEGDYYNKNRIERSIDNLFYIGTFESVTIDTVSKEYASDDFIRDFVITSKYRNLREWEGGLFFNQTQIDNLVNAGIEGSLLHRNMFGAAQVIKCFANFSLKDINRSFSKLSFSDFEFKVGATYTQSLIWQLENSRVGLSASFQYSLQILNGFFKILKASFPVSFPVRFSRSSYFKNLSIEFDMNREVPLNYSNVVETALGNAHSRQDTNNILSALILYGNIDNYLNEPSTHIFTSNLLTLSITGDSRNHPFSPTQGSLTYFAVDGFNILFSHPVISGGAKYFRFQATHNKFWQLSNVLVLGMKGKIGLTYLFNEANAFVPQDRQFFAGGANSVRAWSARSLRYSPQEITNELATSAMMRDFANDYIGSKTLIEGSIEFRRKLSDIPGLSDNVALFFNDLGLGLFLDVGNAFGWYIEDADNKVHLKYSDYITKLAVSAGFGLRYETPIGPIRFDFATPVYDPMKIRPPFGDLAFFFAIGHSF